MIRKTAIVIAGSQNNGKTEFIKNFLRPALEMKDADVDFTYGKCSGKIMDTPLQAQNLDLDALDQYEDCQVFIMSARPEHDTTPPDIFKLKMKLVTLGFRVYVTRFEDCKDRPCAEEYMREMVDHIKGNFPRCTDEPVEIPEEEFEI